MPILGLIYSSIVDYQLVVELIIALVAWRTKQKSYLFQFIKNYFILIINNALDNTLREREFITFWLVLMAQLFDDC